MNDETESAGSSQNPPLEFQLPPALDPQPTRASHRLLSYWARKFLVCNPFYLASAALLLFGLYRVSIDPNFLLAETRQLTFNFTSLQLYELLLVATAMLLARRLIWYDAKLLVAIENMLVLVPFILISQAALIEQQAVWVFCGAAALFAVARSGLAQRGVAALRFPPRLAVIGGCALALNTWWPVAYRHLHETTVGTKLESGAAFEMHELGWLVLLPALIALANLLPRPHEDGKSPVQGRRFPVGLFALWIAGTAVHLYSLGYVYDFDLHWEWLAPALWVLAWTLHLRLPDSVESLSPLARKLTFLLPLPVTLLAANEAGSNVLFTLNALNLLAFAWFVWTERGNRLALHLGLLSFAAAVAAVPAPIFHFAAGWLQRTNLMGLAVLAYVMVATLLTRNPKAAILGALAAGLAGGVWREHETDATHWAMQAGVVFFLLHSLRWRDYEHQGAAGVRAVAAVFWVAHTLVWVRDSALFWQPLGLAGGVFVAWWFRGFVFRNWAPIVVPIAGALVVLCGPANLAYMRLQSTPLGVLAVLASFLLFGVGTVAALTKHRRHKSGLP